MERGNTGPSLASFTCYFCDLGQITKQSCNKHGHPYHTPCICKAWGVRPGCWQLGSYSHPGLHQILRA